MEAHQLRVKIECEDLDERLEKLHVFIEDSSAFRTLDKMDQRLLIDQRHAMSVYRDILRMRITRFKMPEMPLYTCHKQVRALKIADVKVVGTDTTTDENEIVLITFEDASFPPLRVSLRGKPTPEAGFFYVVYNDGYWSFSPAKAFEEGYSLVEV